ncbi:MAG: hypothetical protein ACJ0BD_03295 [Gammaproteobacteria bacterium]
MIKNISIFLIAIAFSGFLSAGGGELAIKQKEAKRLLEEAESFSSESQKEETKPLALKNSHKIRLFKNGWKGPNF